MLKKIYLLLIFTLLTQCGFKIVERSLNEYNIESINTEGNNKINFLIKNSLIKNKNTSENKKNLRIELKTDLKEEVFEKNIRNEVTKYRVIINTKVGLSFDNYDTQNFTISKVGEYRVGSTSLESSTNVGNLEQSLSKEIVKEIEKKVLVLKNDF